MASQYAKVERLAAAAVIASLVLLAAMIATSPSRRVYDERYYLRFAEHVRDTGWHEALTAKSNNHSSSVGPLYPAVHRALSPLTGLQPPAVRWVNYVGLLLLIVIVSRSAPGADWRNGLIGASSILAVPFLWPTAGLALTEMPALVLFMLAVYWMLRVLRVPEAEQSRRTYAWALFAGALLGLSILGRQTYLVGVPAIAALVVVRPRQWKLWLAAAGAAVMVSGWLFILWGGLLPPAVQYADTHLDSSRAVKSLSYVAAATLLLNPRWLRPESLKVLFGLLAAGAAYAMLIFDWTDAPALSMLRRLGDWMLPVGYCILIGMTSVGFLWAWNALRRAWQDRRDPERVFLFLALFALVVAPAKGFGFSSRYVVGGLGVLVLVLDLPRAFDRWLGLRILAGSLIGAVSLLAYYRT